MDHMPVLEYLDRTFEAKQPKKHPKLVTSVYQLIGMLADAAPGDEYLNALGVYQTLCGMNVAAKTLGHKGVAAWIGNFCVAFEVGFERQRRKAAKKAKRRQAKRIKKS